MTTQYQCEDCTQMFGGEPFYTIGPGAFLCPVCAGPFLVPDSPVLQDDTPTLDGVPGAIDTTGRGDWDAGPVTVRVEDIGASEGATVGQVSVYGVMGGWEAPQDWGASFELSVAEARAMIRALQAIVDTHDTGEGINAAQAAYRARLAR
jgi:hypothetical protein